jgi:acyl-CoA reductase-like NAD-dependent aldehyde dehydrogenase
LRLQATDGVLEAEQLDRLGATLAEGVSSRTEEFIDAAVRDVGFPSTSARHEVDLVVEQLRSLRLIEPWIRGRVPICADGQEVALLLPYNTVSWAVWDCAALLAAGNRVRLRLSRRAGRISELVEATLRERVGDGVTVLEDPGPQFVDVALRLDEIPLLVAYGSERLGDGLLERVPHLQRKKVVFEGPGKDPAIVLEGADPARAAAAIADSKFELSGQQCIAPEVVICHGSIHNELVEQLIQAFGEVKVGDPADPATQVGPMGSARVPEMIRRQLDEARSGGAEVACGGDISDDWVSPTLVLNVTPEMTIFQEETFGPVLGVVRVSDEEEALSIARQTRFGLNCMLFGPRAQACATRLQGDRYATPTPELVYGRFGTTSLEGPLFAEGGAGFEPFGGYGKSGWIWDSGTLFQGPKLFAREASRESRRAVKGLS